MTDRLMDSGIVAIARGDFDPGHLLEVARVLVSSGITALEVTLNSRAALDLISQLRSQLGDRLLIGAGTVVSAADVDAAAEAGAEYLIAPGLDENSVARARTLGLPFIPGVLTPSETARALALGCSLLKLFPAATMGPDYIQQLRGPFPQARFMATGGIGVNNLASFAAAGASAFGIGSSLITPGRPSSDLRESADALIAELQRVRTGGQP